VRESNQRLKNWIEDARCLTPKCDPELAQKPNIDGPIGRVQQQDKSSEALSLRIYRRRILQSANTSSSRVQVCIIAINSNI
jgi:hypothetical protein